ncbi:hypothetical protein AUJ66_03840 [Candidatus Desantisbacteria bacterium CG1_02_38_46]|uniref:Uncharacterized protein n=3 Tax=unclassified Candidatus Desantisiibacteriota TaxID=3106372 RepID=A0A2H9PCM3_9BACT|nr:MAG: hypothetical protein AUJ66_03840 [Candidatus Desantisbacteria bacterium CG1_02_38_46]PIU51563.1 MAG: hypothetical protein COS91_03825 [Candidatus Desantisbacteria bacterium CG07_land_8_20_14_0_80_39_15]PIZ17023.1 MAG: hypothetical protein COY51_01350 [Candidatus Desantisbacteria bacterium CG_4_10_14_0_8_um_filter_39_17]
MTGKLKKSWQEKLEDSKGLPKVEKITKKMSGRWGTKEGNTVVIPAPTEVDEIMKKVPKGKIITINRIREVLARKHNATIGCPITTGIFARIAAGAAGDAERAGEKDITPYWRTLKSGGDLNEKYPGGVQRQARRLQEEGLEIEPGKGKKPPKVKDFERYLVEL